MDSELTNITAVKALNQGVATGDSPTFVAVTGTLATAAQTNITSVGTLSALTVTGEITANGGIALGDNDKATFGDSDDLEIFHSGTESVIRDVGTGRLVIRGTNLDLETSTGEYILRGIADGATQVYHNGSEKLSTTATGIDVTGTVTADNAEIGTLGASDANAIIDLTGDTTYTDFGFRIIRNSGANGRTDLRHRGTGDFVIEAVEAAEIAFETSDTERFRIAADGSLSTPTLGTSNVRFGVNAGNSIESGGNYNTVVGDEAGTAITTGNTNTGVGYKALALTTTGSTNVGLGAYALQRNTTAAYNTGVGYDVLGNNTTGDLNVAIGYEALGTNVAGDKSVAIGVQALYAQNPSGNADMYNTAVGYTAGTAVTTGTNNTLIGGLAGDAITTGGDNVAVGYNSLGVNTTGGSNTALGAYALDANTTAGDNTAVGAGAVGANTTGAGNTGIGRVALTTNTTGADNTAVGYRALNLNTTASNNTAVGKDALYANTTGTNNVAVGAESLDAIVSSNDCTAVGYRALSANTANANTALGAESMQFNTSGVM
jgi:hypothetical protein